MDLTGYPHTACIHFIACSVDGRSYTLLASRNIRLAFLEGLRGCHCPLVCTRGMRYLPFLSLTPINSGSPLHVISISSSLYTATPLFVNTDVVSSSANWLTLINDELKLSNVSAFVALLEKFFNGIWTSYLPELMPPLATNTFLFDFLNIGMFNFFLSSSVM